jgi:hypothetical protein
MELRDVDEVVMGVFFGEVGGTKKRHNQRQNGTHLAIK